MQENPYLKSKKLPATEKEFMFKFGISMKKGSNILKELVKRIHEINPKIKINHNAWTTKDLNTLFNFAGHDYQMLMENIHNYNFNMFSQSKCIKDICQEYSRTNKTETKDIKD